MRIEYASARKLRSRNTVTYRLAHWPIWIAVFFLSPGPIVFSLFAYGWDRRMLLWLTIVLAGTGIAGIFGELPGVEPRPYILKFTEDKPNPWYRRVCYTFAWNAVLNYALMNLAGLIVAAITHRWYMKQIYTTAYFPLAFVIWGVALAGLLPRVKRSTRGEGVERRYFYGSVWAVCVAQPVLGLLWVVLPKTPATDVIKLLVFVGVLVGMAVLAVKGQLLRTRRIVPGEIIVAD